MTPPLTVLAPVAGTVVAMADVPDPVFAGEIVGPGLAIDPSRGGTVVVVAPVAGRIAKLHAHAFVIQSDARLTYDEKSHRDLLDELNERLVDKYFVNFSVFESMPDVWAIQQVFPIVPIERLDELPTRRGVIADLTCDSDGRIDTYVENESMNTSMPLRSGSSK